MGLVGVRGRHKRAYGDQRPEQESKNFAPALHELQNDQLNPIQQDSNRPTERIRAAAMNQRTAVAKAPLVGRPVVTEFRWLAATLARTQ